MIHHNVQVNTFFVLIEQVATSIVEIDEAVLGKKAKNQRGRRYKNTWVFGMVERQTRNLSLHVVGDRRKETLIPILQKHVSTRAKIFHDDWASYRSLNSYGYDHATVNHTKEFVSPEGTCTNTIEGIWGLVKARIRKMHGIANRRQTQDVLDEFVYRYRHTGMVFNSLLRDIAKKYPV